MSSPLRNGLSGQTLKIIAMLSMLLDHIGTLFATKSSGLAVMFHGIGRLAFPIYAFLLVEGLFHTHSRRNYALRLLLFAFLSELPFDLAISAVPFAWKSQNVFFTLFLGLLALCGAECFLQRDVPLLSLFSILVCAVTAEFLCTDYGATGVLLIAAFWLAPRFGTYRWVWNLFAILLLFLGSSLIWFYCIPVVLLALYNGHKGRSSPIIQFSFYAFYPLHLLVLAGIHWIL